MHHACMMKSPQAGRAIAVLRCRDRGKSALLRARRRIAPGAGKPPRGVNLPEKGHRNKQPTPTQTLPQFGGGQGGGGHGEKVV